MWLNTLIRNITHKTRYFITSLTVFSDALKRDKINDHIRLYYQQIYVPGGAGWGLQDIAKMAHLNAIERLNVSMTFHIDALKLTASNEDALEYLKNQPEQSYLVHSGDIAEIARLAPNNVNTMCALALAAGTGGFTMVYGELYVKQVNHDHEVVIDVFGPNGYHVHTCRINPSNPGAVTGSMTFWSFWSSLIDVSDHWSSVDHDMKLIFV